MDAKAFAQMAQDLQVTDLLALRRRVGDTLREEQQVVHQGRYLVEFPRRPVDAGLSTGAEFTGMGEAVRQYSQPLRPGRLSADGFLRYLAFRQAPWLLAVGQQRLRTP